jgi:hypothetical protein
MSATDAILRLERSLRRSHDLLRQLLQGLQNRRTQWASAVPSRLAPSDELDQLAGQIADETTARDAILAELRTALPALPNVASDDLHLNVTRLCATLPRPQAQALRRTADDVTRLARQVRAEVTFGQRLLRFTQNAQEQTLAAAAGAAAATTTGYDRHARTRSGYGLGVPRAGSLLDGRI